jgi:hypothetical protein
MKNNLIPMKAVALKAFLCGFFVLVSISCAKEESGIGDQLIGHWKLTAKSIDNLPVSLSACEQQNGIIFQENNICLLIDGCTGDTANSGWNYKDEMLNISIHLPAAYYVDQVDEATLKIRRKDISPEGNLQVTLLSYLK